MLKSLFAGVSGLQSHQVAMDVESNNIANVNTTGFKYSRANFSDLLAQTKSIATAPQGDLGGKNSVQVGLGSTVGSMTTIYSQGSIQNSDKNTDVAIQGDGFFIVSPDGGKSYKYTRAGDFKFDANGNFVDNNGFIVQGWTRDPVTGKVDSTAPIESIQIPPGLTTPASPTTEVVLKANLNAGTTVESYSPAYSVSSGTAAGNRDIAALDSLGNPIASGNLGVMFNGAGEAFSLQENQGVWMSFKNTVKDDSAAILASTPAVFNMPLAGSDGTDNQLDIAIGGIDITFAASGAGALDQDQNGAWYASEINAALGGSATIVANYDSSLNQLIITNTAKDPVAITASTTPAFDPGTSGITLLGAFGGEQLELDFELDNGDTVSIKTSGGTGTETINENANRYVTAINAKSSITGVTATFDVSSSKIILTNTNSNGAASHNIRVTKIGSDDSGITSVLPGDALDTAFRYQYTSSEVSGGTGQGDTDKKFTTIADLRNQMEIQARHVIDTDFDGVRESNIEVIVNAEGKIEIKNPGGANDDGYTVQLAVTGMTAKSVFAGGISENNKFSSNMEALNGILPDGSSSSISSQSFSAATHSSSIDIFDSLGSKHTLRMEFRKTALSLESGSTWDLKITVPEPSTLEQTGTQEQRGSIDFNNDGSLKKWNPPGVNFNGNNGSSPQQAVDFNFGSTDAFDGMTSFDSRSSTSGISQDGFTGGDLVGIRIDQSGTMVGSFSNGRSFGLAQVGMAKFTNNEGLSTQGGSVYVQTANSGDPIIGSAATSGRGFIQSSALEASNVDLSRSLTQLIIIQRGYQANGKTITTSDQLLQTLIGLKN